MLILAGAIIHSQFPQPPHKKHLQMQRHSSNEGNRPVQIHNEIETTLAKHINTHCAPRIVHFLTHIAAKYMQTPSEYLQRIGLEGSMGCMLSADLSQTDTGKDPSNGATC